MAKKYNRGRQQKRNVDRRKLEKYREEVARELGVELPEKRKKIFILRKKQGRSVREIAEEMGISVKTVENQITEAMKYLKTRFEEELPGGMIFFVLFVDHP